MARRRRIVLLAALAPISACTGYLLFWPTGLDPEEWRPPEAAELHPNQALIGATILEQELPGPEAIAVDPSGRLVTGLADGRVVRFLPGGGPVEAIARTGGRPLGLAFEPGGRLIVADADRGLLAVSAAGQVSVLADRVGGRRFRFCDDVAVARDGTIYFTEASDRHPVSDYELEVIEHRPRGRVLSYDPRTGQIAVVAAGFYFANGIAMAPDDSYLVVAETASYRVRRVWLTGARRGAVEPWVDNLPGFPDNVRWAPERRAFWIALGAPRDRTVDRLAGHPFLRQVIARLPGFLRPGPKRHAFALAYGEDGALRHDLQATGESAYAPVATVLEWQGRLYLGSFSARGIASAPAPGLPP